jgi:hypothetical protein
MVVIVAPEAREAMEHGTYRWNPFPIGRVIEGDKKVRLTNL